VSTLNRKSAEHVHAAWVTIPHVTQFDEADITAVEKLRRNHKDSGDKVKLTVTAFAIKASVAALKAFPKLNSSLDHSAGELIRKNYYHIGVAVDTEAGLIVPVIRDADRKSVLEIAAELADLSERTRQRKVGLEELRGGTFTITNLGGIGGTSFTPIVNYPEVAILGISRTREVPVLRDGQLVTQPILPLSLSYDHRVINGADGARFLRKLASFIEDPGLLLLQI
jgi:pyruvate dehydrogenase E2 component (dihydrolipoamide acetyltransferase)